MIIDTHAHYSHFKFDNTYKYLSYSGDGYSICEGEREKVFDEIKEAGICAFIEPGINLESNSALLELAQKYPGFVFPAVGVHPTRVFKEKWTDRKKIDALSENANVIAIGETGLDFHYARKDQHRFWQYAWFLYQLTIAYKKKLPLILHIRNASKQAIRILKLYQGRKYGGVIHCFCEGADVAKQYVRMGFHLGIGGALLQSDERSELMKEAIREVPLEHILIETDSPYVHPQCPVLAGTKMYRKVRNTSLILPAVISEIARIKGMAYAEVESITTKNAVGLFGLKI